MRNKIFTIFWKEFREIYRDRRTIISTVIGPLLITPGLLALVGIVITKQNEKAATATYSVGVIGGNDSPALMRALRSKKNMVLEDTTVALAEKQIRGKTMDSAIILQPETDSLIASNKPVEIKLIVDVGSDTSRNAKDRLDEIFQSIGKKTLEKRLSEHNLPAQFATPFEIKEQPITGGAGIAMLLLSRFLPYMLILSAFSGAIYAAFDQVAGEKERGTLETLLVTPVTRRDIVLGKFSAVVCVCLVTSLLSISGLMLTFLTRSKAFAWLSNGGVHLSVASMGVILLALLPISILFAGILLTVSTFARNQKEAQSYLGGLFPIILVPAMLSLLLGTDVPRAVALVPLLNASLIIKQAIIGSYDPLFITIAVVASAVYAGAALLVAMSLFQKESVLIKA